ncbi:MAG: hypothetical protein JXR30_02545 [Alphaproteobacteria bacterium]|nr:hypothetical protein [Alphaproteobacteria bacterium]
MRSRGNLLFEILLVLAIMVIAIPFVMEKQFARRETSQEQAIAHRIRQLGAVALSYIRSDPEIQEGLTVLSGQSMISLLSKYGLANSFDLTDRFSQNYEIHIKRTYKNNNALTSGFVVVYPPIEMEEKPLSYLKSRHIADSIGALGAIVDEDGEIINVSGIWSLSKEEWGYSLPTQAILMAIQPVDVSYNFLARYKIDEINQGNTFLTDLSMGGNNNIENVVGVFAKNFYTEQMSIYNLQVIENIHLPKAQFDQVTIYSVLGQTAGRQNTTTLRVENNLNISEGGLVRELHLFGMENVVQKETILTEVKLSKLCLNNIDGSEANNRLVTVTYELSLKNDTGEPFVIEEGDLYENSFEVRYAIKSKPTRIQEKADEPGIYEEVSPGYLNLTLNNDSILYTPKILFSPYQQGEETYSDLYTYMFDFDGTNTLLPSLDVENLEGSELLIILTEGSPSVKTAIEKIYDKLYRDLCTTIERVDSVENCTEVFK